MKDFNKREILDICKECIPNSSINEDFKLESKSDVINRMFMLGIDVSNVDCDTDAYEIERINRYN